MPAPLGSNESDSNASIAAVMSPQAADCAKEAGRSAATTPGTRNDSPMKRKLCSISSGRSASARERWRSAGQMARAGTVPHATRLNAMLAKKATWAGMGYLLGGETTDDRVGLTAGRRWPRSAKVVPAPPHLRFG